MRNHRNRSIAIARRVDAQRDAMQFLVLSSSLALALTAGLGLLLRLIGP